MSADVIERMVGSLGFPIICVLGLAYFIWKAFEKISEQNINREEKLYTMLGKSQEQLDRLENINNDFVKVLDQFKQDNVKIKEDLEDIKETVRKLPKIKTDTEDKS